MFEAQVRVVAAAPGVIISTHDAPPQTDTCNAAEETHERDRFDPGEVVFYAAFYRDQLAGQTSTYTIRRPNGSVHATWQHASPVPHYAASWWYWYQILPGDAPFGTWRFEVSFLEQEEAHEFQVPEPGAWAQGWVALGTVGVAAAATRRRRAARGRPRHRPRLAKARPGQDRNDRPRDTLVHAAALALRHVSSLQIEDHLLDRPRIRKRRAQVVDLAGRNGKSVVPADVEPGVPREAERHGVL